MSDTTHSLQAHAPPCVASDQQGFPEALGKRKGCTASQQLRGAPQSQAHTHMLDFFNCLSKLVEKHKLKAVASCLICALGLSSDFQAAEQFILLFSSAAQHSYTSSGAQIKQCYTGL